MSEKYDESETQQIPDTINLEDLLDGSANTSSDDIEYYEEDDGKSYDDLPRPPIPVRPPKTYDDIVESVLMDLKWKMSMDKHIQQEQERYWLIFDVSIPPDIRNVIRGTLKEAGKASVWLSDREIQVELLNPDELAEVQQRKKIEKEKRTKEFNEFIKELDKQKPDPFQQHPAESNLSKKWDRPRHDDRKRDMENWKKSSDRKDQKENQIIKTPIIIPTPPVPIAVPPTPPPATKQEDDDDKSWIKVGRRRKPKNPKNQGELIKKGPVVASHNVSHGGRGKNFSNPQAVSGRPSGGGDRKLPSRNHNPHNSPERGVFSRAQRGQGRQGRGKG